jgi:hypothetical protein
VGGGRSKELSTDYRVVDRVQGFFSSPELGPPHPLNRRRVCPPPFGSGRGTHSLACEGVEGPNSDERTDTVVLKVYMYFVDLRFFPPKWTTGEVTELIFWKDRYSIFLNLF